LFLVRALKRVDFPTFGSPTIPIERLTRRLAYGALSVLPATIRL